jgi:hypothetical protein
MTIFAQPCLAWQTSRSIGSLNQDVPNEFGKTNEEQINEYLRRYEKIRKSIYEVEIGALPTACDEGGKNPL